MSQQLISRSPDLTRLLADGYNIEVQQAHLVVRDVPYVNSTREVKQGVFLTPLTTAGNRTAKPKTHVIHFAGDNPCNEKGAELQLNRHGGPQTIGNVVLECSFSRKPPNGYQDYYELVTTYVAVLGSHAQAIDPTATARTYPVIRTAEDDSVFEYVETASSRAGITNATQKLERHRIAIVGLGGTGSYVLDLVAKTPVDEIHLFDGDTLLTHNAFRAPGAPSTAELEDKPKKVSYLRHVYSKMRRAIVEHAYYVDPSNVAELKGMDFVFLCIDAGEAKKCIVENLETFGVRFIDVGLGMELVDDSLRGSVRVTTSIPEKRDHFRTRVSLADAAVDEVYDTNIQVADLNALNAALAVIRWKKLCGFYLDFRGEFNSSYDIDVNSMINDDTL